jgi:enhancer of mRNA-decapping protein 4
LAALRRKTQGSTVSAPPDETKFAARSSAVHALEQAIATGASPEAGARKAARGCAVTTASNGTFVYNLDDSHPGEEYPELTFAPVTRVPADYKEAHVRQVAVSEEFITYGLKQGHIRVLHRFSEARALLKGHKQLITDICFVGDDVVIAGGQDGELFGWKLSVHDGDNAIHADQFLHAKFSPGCDTSPVTLEPLSSRSEVAVAVGNAVMVLHPLVDVAVDLEIDPLDPTPALKMPNFPVQDAPTAIAGTEDGTYLAAGSKHGRVYIAKIESDGSIVARAQLDVGAGSPISAVAWLTSTTLLVSTVSGTKQMLFSTTDDAVSFVPGESVVLETSASSKESSSFVHTEVVSAQNLVIMADTPRKQVYTLHYSAVPAGHAVRFDYLARFKVGLPILNFTAVWNPDQGEEGAVEIDCVQTEAVQQYFLDPKLCSVEGSGAAAAAAAAAGDINSTMTQIQETSCASSNDVVGPSASRNLHADGRATSFESKEEEMAAAAIEEESQSEGCMSPPASRADSSLPDIEIPVTSTGASEPSPAAPAGVPTKLLTPTDILRSTSKDITPRAVSNPPPPTMKILQRKNMNNSSNTTPSAQPILPPEPEDIALPTVATTAAAAIAAPAAGNGSQPDLAAVVAKEMSAMQRNFAVQVSAMNKDLLKAVRSDLTAQNAANAKLMREALAAQATAVAAERAALLAEERANMERLLGAISASINNDVPARLSEIMRTELDGVASAIAATMTPAVKEAVAAALPKETSAAIKSALDKQLASSLQTGLTKPIQESFRQAFTKQIVPSFENACQSMFLQMDKTLAKGFYEHSEATKSALSEPVALAASLRESLADAARLGGGAFSGEGSVGGLARAPSVASSMRSPRTVDVKTELRGMMTQGRYEEAFSKALGLQEVSTVGWLCTQADAATVLSASPPALSQMVLLSLIQQLAADISSSPSNKLQWIREAALALNPQDPLLGPHLRPVLEQVHAALAAAVGKMQGGEVQSCKLAMHVIHSQMSS